MHSNLLGTIYCNSDGHVVRFYIRFLKADMFFFLFFFIIKVADSQYIVLMFNKCTIIPFMLYWKVFTVSPPIALYTFFF